MFGLCVFNRKKNQKWQVLVFGLLIFLGLGLVQADAQAQAQKGTVMNDQVMVYQEADFDSPVVTTVSVGSVYDISKKKKGPFYKVRLKPGYTAWIADTDIKPGINKNAVHFAEKRKSKKKSKDNDTPLSKKKFEDQRYRGPVFESVQFAEDTMGRVRSESVLFYGYKFTGPNTLFDGEMITDSNILIHFGAPSYYGVTGNSASGWILMANFLFQNVEPLSPTAYYFYGFGPMFRYSHYDLALTNSASSTTSYSVEDMTLGAVIDLGVGVRISKFSIRGETKYYWEKQKYLALGLSVLFEF